MASHLADTIEAGAGIVDEEIARLMTSKAAERILDLLEVGVPFDKDLEGKLKLSREAAHSASRIVRVSGDKAGFAIMEALIQRVVEIPLDPHRLGLSGRTAAYGWPLCVRCDRA